MATPTLALASTGSTVSSSVRDSSKLSSRSAFGTSLVQFAPLRRSLPTAKGVVVVRANLSEDQSATGKKVLGSILAAGAALSIAGQALAGNPIDFAKSKADDVASSAQNAVSNFPNVPKIELPNAGALQNAGKAAGGAFQNVQGRMDGIFGKNKPYTQGRVASTNGGTGSAIGDAKKRISDFPAKNPFAENLTKTTEEFEATLPEATGENSGSALSAREFLGKDSTRVDEATRRVGELGDNFKRKAGDAFDEAKGFVGSVQDATPDAPSIPTPELPSLPNPLEGVNKNMQDIKGTIGKGNLASKASDVKGAVTSKASDMTNNNSPNDVVYGAKDLLGSAQDAAKDATSNFPSFPNPFEDFSKSVQGKTDDVKDSVASKVDDVKGDVSSKVSDVSNKGLGDVANGAKSLAGTVGNKNMGNPVDGAKNAVGSAQDAVDNASVKAPSALNLFGGIGKKVQGTAANTKDNVASAVDSVKGDVSSKASSIRSSTPGDAVGAAKNAAQDATSKLPSLPNPFEGMGKKDAQGNAANVKDNVASKVDDVKGDVSSKVSNLKDSSPGDVVDGAKDLVGSAQDAASSLPSLPNPLEGLKNLTGKASDAINLDNVPNPGNLEEGLKAKASLK